MKILSLLGACGIAPAFSIAMIGARKKQRHTLRALQIIYREIDCRSPDAQRKRNLAADFTAVLAKLRSSTGWREIQREVQYSPYVTALFFVRNQESLHGEAHNKLIFSGELSQDHLRLLQRELIPT